MSQIIIRWARRITRAAALVCAIGVVSLSSGEARAQRVYVVPGSVSPTIFSVSSNGENYTSAAPFNRFEAQVGLNNDGFSSFEARIKRVAIWAEIKAAPHPAISGHPLRYEKTYPVGQRPNDIDSTVTAEMHKGQLSNWLVSICRRNLSQLRSAGFSDRQIFSHDYEVDLEVYGRGFIDWTVGGAFDEESIQPHAAKLTCKKFAGPQVPTAGALQAPDRVVDVERASLRVVPVAGQSGVCKLQLSYALKTVRGRGEVTFRYRDARGHSSETKTVTTNALGLAVGSHSYVLANAGGDQTGEVWMQGVGDTPFESDATSYRAACRKPGATGLTTNPSTPSGSETELLILVTPTIVPPPSSDTRRQQGRSAVGRRRVAH